MTNKEFDVACAEARKHHSLKEFVAEAIELRCRLIESIGEQDVWDQEDPIVNYEPYVDDGDTEAQNLETSNSLRKWAKAH